MNEKLLNNAHFLDGVEVVEYKEGCWNKSLLYMSQVVGKNRYLNSTCAFDIESSYIEELDESIMYIWQFAIGPTYCIVGRTWEEFLCMVSELLGIASETEARLVVYVHNLSYEFQFIRSLLEFDEHDVFIIRSRKILLAVYRDSIEFRCSWLLSNMSLHEFTYKLNVPHKKLAGQLDYDIRRTPSTPISEEELAYCINDVIGLVEAIDVSMKIDGDDLSTIPKTSTGYVRRDVREALKPIQKDVIEPLKPDYSTYVKLREAMRGGNTHANRYYVGKVLEKVYSSDRDSSYPDVQVNDKFPITPFVTIGEASRDDIEFLMRRGKALLFRCRFVNIRLGNIYIGCPYLSLAKCRGVVNGVIDNGRILSCDYLTTTLTDVDYRIIAHDYIWDSMDIFDLSWSTYGDLPVLLKEQIINYYKSKTSLKGVEGQEVYYIKKKNKLNSIYGMSAQDPVKQRIVLRGMEYVELIEDEEDLLTESNTVLPYQWGVWTTALARYRLQEGIWLAGDDFVYCDTDCVKSLKPVNFDAYNRARRERDKETGAYAIDKYGEVFYMGEFELEKVADKFVTWGAKRYVIEYKNRLFVTVSGVRKNTAPDELHKLGGIEAFKPGLTFYESGGFEFKYNDHEPKDVLVDAEHIMLTSNVNLRPRTYTLGIASEYDELLNIINGETNY